MKNRPDDNAQELPHWFQKANLSATQQLSLFTEALPDVLATLRISSDELTRWHQRRWVSIGPDRREPLQPFEVDELQFVRDVVRSGLPDAFIARLFSELPRPMAFDPRAIAYSFTLGWVVANTDPPPAPDDVVNDHLDTWLTTLAEDRERDRLTELRDRIEELLASVPADDEESD